MFLIDEIKMHNGPMTKLKDFFFFFFANYFRYSLHKIQIEDIQPYVIYISQGVHFLAIFLYILGVEKQSHPAHTSEFSVHFYKNNSCA